MRVANCKKCRERIFKEAEEAFLKQQYVIYKDMSYTFAVFSTAAVLGVFYRRGMSKKYVQKLFKDICFMYNFPAAFGKNFFRFRQVFIREAVLCLLGQPFDIHGGGKALLFPHHENEIAQTSGATGKPYVNYWMHNGFINVDNQKMSKSLGNFFTVRDIAKEYDLEAVRMFTLSAHYRSPLNFSREQIAQAQSSLERLYIARDQLAFLENAAKDREPNEAEAAFMKFADQSRERFIAAMDDDLNTADALGAIFELVREVHKLNATDVSRQAVQYGKEKLLGMTDVLGLLMKKEDGLPADVQALVDERAQARKEKNWKRSDELRDQIKAMGYILEDTAAGQKVRKGV